jgi:hypothetical protein
MRMVTLFVLLACFDAQEQRLALPSAADQKKAEAEIRSVFKDDFAKKDRDSRRSLAQKLLAQAADTKNTPASRYAVLLLARDLASEAVDIDTIFTSIEQLEKLYDLGKPPLAGASFTVDLYAQKIFALNGAKKFATTPADAVALSDAYLRVAEDALKQKTLDDAFAAAQAAEQYARSAKSTPGLARASQLVRELPELNKGGRAVRQNRLGGHRRRGRKAGERPLLPVRRRRRESRHPEPPGMLRRRAEKRGEA